jgi:hypothetical protein
MKTIKIKLTSNVMIEGKTVKAGATVDAPRTVALDLLARKRAVEAEAPAAPAVEPEPEPVKKRGKAAKEVEPAKEAETEN